MGGVKEGWVIRRLVLTGFRGSGKTTVGKILSDRLGTEFFETDLMIEKSAGMDIPDIFSKYGESHFRELERCVIKELPISD
ncbi:MAG: shikimate kinase, partial [Methanomicrobium sp.]|nr:shikimate kinase [Methanomicrobium sp.]